MPNLVRLHLANGQHRHIAADDSVHPEVIWEAINRARHTDGWLETLEGSLVRFEHIIEATFELNAPPAQPLRDHP